MIKLSVIICVYNEGLGIIKALQSLKKNIVFKETEILIVDDCSADVSTIRLLTLIEKFTTIKVIRSQRNLGLSHSRNIGFFNAQAEYVVPLDGDDVLPSNALDIVYQTFKENQKADFIAGGYYLRNAETYDITNVDCRSMITNGMVDIQKLAQNWVLLGTSPCRKSVWAAVNGYSLKYSYSVQDMDFWIRVLKNDGKGVYIDRFIYTWNRSASGMNNNVNPRMVTELMAEHIDFYKLHYSITYLANKLFEDFYPYKQLDVLIPFGKKYFFNLKKVNQARYLYFCLQTMLGSNKDKDNRP